MAATILHLIMRQRGHDHLRWDDVTPVFAILAAGTLFSLIWFARLPKDAGDEMNNRVKPARD